MASEIEKGGGQKDVDAGFSGISKSPSFHQGSMGVADDEAIRDFYGSAVNEAYRLKSELISEHLLNIGMGK
jgi:hypothetical protein